MRLAVFWCAVISVAVLRTTGAAEPMGLPEALGGARLGPAVASVELPAPGHLRLTETGTAAAVLGGDGRMLGWAFGRCVAEYDPSGYGEKAVRMNFDRARVPVLSGYGKGPLRMQLDGALWLSAGERETPAGDAARPDENTGALLRRFRGSEVYGGVELEPMILLAEGILAARPKTTVAILRKERSFWFYAFDAETGLEDLVFGRAPIPAPRGLEEWLVGFRLDRRPVTRGRAPEPRPPAEIRSLDVDVEELPGEYASIRATEGILAVRPLRSLRLRLREADFDTLTETVRIEMRRTSISSVTDAAGVRLPFVRAGEGLLVILPAPVAAGTTTTIVTRYAYGLSRPWGDSYWRLADQAWYPQVGSVRGNWTTFHATVSAKKPFLPFGTGKLVSRSTSETSNRAEFSEPDPIAFPALLAGKYFPHRAQGEGLPLTVASYGMERKDGSAKLAAIVRALVGMESRILGPPRVKELTVCEIRDWGWGQAPSGFVHITQEAFNPVVNALSGTRFFHGGVNERIAHEVSHLWWGHGFRVVHEQDQWLEESTAEYMAAVLLGLARNQAAYDELVDYWKHRSAEVPKGISIAEANLLHWDQDKNWRFDLLYCRGPYLLHTLRRELGDQVFFTVLRSFLKSFDGKRAGTADFLGLLGHVTKKDWTSWAERFVYGAETPEAGD